MKQNIERQIDDYLEEKSKRRNHMLYKASTAVLVVSCAWAFGVTHGKKDVTVITPEVEKVVIQEQTVERFKGVQVSDISNMAVTIMYEARSETMRGQLAVGHVINNRFKYDESCDSISEVVKEPYQFSVWNKNDPNYPKIVGMQLYPDNATDVSQKEYAIAWKVAVDVLTGNTKDPTNGATMYLNPKKVDIKPEWFKVCTSKQVIGEHTFCYYESGFCDRG